MFRYIFFLSAALLCSRCASAQSGKLFTVDSELSSSMVTDVHQGRSGYVWIATEDGLNRFDGIKFKVYRHNEHDPHSVLNDMALVLAEDKQGQMYVGYINGVQYYDAASDSFHHIPLKLQNGQEIAAHVLTIVQRKNGQMLVGTSGHGIFELQQRAGRWEGTKLEGLVPSNMIIRIFEDHKENLWIATEDNGLFRFGDGKLTDYFAAKKVQNNVVSSICEDKYGTIFVGNMSGGLFRYNTIDDAFVRVHYSGGGDLAVADLLVSSRNELYIATNGAGMKLYDEESGVVKDMDLTMTTFDFNTTKINSILEDNAGNIWMGMYQRGVFLLPTHKNSFGYIGYKSVNRNLIGSNCVMSIFEDSKGTFWIGTDNDGLYALGPDGGSSRHYGCRGGVRSVPSTIMSIYEDSYGDLWIGSYSDGLAKFNPHTGQSTYLTELVDKNGDNVQRIYGLREDKEQRLWIASMGSGLFCLDLKSGTIRNFSAVDGTVYRPDSNYLPNDWINCLLLSRNNKLYIGTFDGLACLDLENENFVTAFGTNRLLSNTVVYSLHDDDKGHLWAGTSRGLVCLNIATLEMNIFDMDNGLPSNLICAVEGGPNGDIWVSTNRGIAKMDVSESRFLNFYAGDGLQGNEFMTKVSLAAKNGDLYFGGIHGVTYFRPGEIHIQNKKRIVNIVDFYVRDKAVRKGMKSGRYAIVDTAVNHAQTFHLDYRDNSFSVEFSTMDFNDSERVSYVYSLNNNEWLALRPGNNRLAFDNLEAGEYRLRIRARSNDTFSDIKEARIIIHPVWFQSTLAKWMYALVTIMISVAIAKAYRNRRRIQQQMQVHQQAEAVNEAKLQFFINIAHEIRTPLTLIVSPLKKLMGDKSDDKRTRLYTIMDRNVRRILDLVNQLMDIRKIEKRQMTLRFERVEMNQFTRAVCLLFEEQLDAKDIRLEIDCPESELFAIIDPRHFDKILINILSNACKFTPLGGTIRVSLRSEFIGMDATEYLTIAITDSGQFINEDEKERIFECFYQSPHHRDHHPNGTGIGLYLAKQLMEMHSGTIGVENVAGEGCRFQLQLPIGDVSQIPVFSPTHFGTTDRIRITPIADSDQDEMKHRKSSKVVIVDDDLEICDYIRSEFESFYTVVTYHNGEDAYKGILKDTPDLIVSDVMMPGMDGMTLCGRIKSCPLVRHVPIILLTAKAEESDTEDGFDAGADAYLVKPFYMTVLLKTAKSLIRNRELVKNSEREAQFQGEFISKVKLKSSDEKLLEKVHRIIDRNLNESRLSVEMIANEIGISRVHLHRKLKELTGLTTRDLIRNIRLKQAAELITHKGLSVSEVAYAVGYADANTFSVAFKQLYGVSPTAYYTTNDV
ncbi:response regulator [Parapedobacter sp. ISTM3]|uniref:hybrid sensor histidine kinase/response regulator transcription factor n=1 Tax=Parapedobacter sp. ISTM3 TaxID=2800130 RepID=UPI0019064255|nr:two-component regulator propeller domain-containing protein [Parapedobacter sp. ISTM3]MBK1439558.1 response regulator [Parapedobacter sp. ISTM3]